MKMLLKMTGTSLIVALAWLAFASAAVAASCADYGLTNQQPWVAYGGAHLNAGQNLPNPPTATNGLRGEVAAFPYMVPLGRILFLESVTLQTLWGVDLVPSIGPLQASPINALDTYTAGPLVATNPSWFNLSPTQQFNAGFQIPAGLSLHVTFRAALGWPSSGGPWQVEWSMHGFLCNGP